MNDTKPKGRTRNNTVSNVGESNDNNYGDETPQSHASPAPGTSESQSVQQQHPPFIGGSKLLHQILMLLLMERSFLLPVHAKFQELERILRQFQQQALILQQQQNEANLQAAGSCLARLVAQVLFSSQQQHQQQQPATNTTAASASASFSPFSFPGFDHIMATAVTKQNNNNTDNGSSSNQAANLGCQANERSDKSQLINVIQSMLRNNMNLTTGTNQATRPSLELESNSRASTPRMSSTLRQEANLRRHSSTGATHMPDNMTLPVATVAAAYSAAIAASTSPDISTSNAPAVHPSQPQKRFYDAQPQHHHDQGSIQSESSRKGGSPAKKLKRTTSDIDDESSSRFNNNESPCQEEEGESSDRNEKDTSFKSVKVAVHVTKRRAYHHEPFPVKVHRMLQESHQHGKINIVSWTPCGKAFEIHDMVLFEQEFLATYFRHSKFASFRRLLNMYGFRRTMTDKGLQGFGHEQFLRERPEWCYQITRVSEINVELVK